MSNTSLGHGTSPRGRVRVMLRAAGGVGFLVAYIWFYGEAMVQTWGAFLFPFVYYFGVRAVVLLPLPAIILLYVPVAAFWLQYSAFHALDLLLTLFALVPLRWILPRAYGVGGSWQPMRRPLIMFIGFFSWAALLATPLETAAGSDYRALQDLELLQVVDVAENYALLTIFTGVVLVAVFPWYLFAKAQQKVRTAAGSSAGATPLRESAALFLAPALTFAMLGFAAESLQLGWPFAALFAVWPAYRDLRRRSTTPSASRFDRVLVQIRDRVLRSAPVGLLARFWRHVHRLAPRLLSIPALTVMLIGSYLYFLSFIFSFDMEEQPLPVVPVSPESAACSEKITALFGRAGYDGEPENLTHEAGSWRAKNVLTQDQYEFSIRLNDVADYRFLRYGQTSADVKWAIDYVQRMTQIRCNLWFPTN